MALYTHYWDAEHGTRRLNLSDEDAHTLIELTNGDLSACFAFIEAQEAAMKAERPIQNVPPDEAGAIELAQREFE